MSGVAAGILSAAAGYITLSHVKTETSAGAVNITVNSIQAGDLMVVHGGIWDDRTGGFYFSSNFSSNFGFTDPTGGQAVDNDQSGSDYRSIASIVAYKIVESTSQTVALFAGAGAADNIAIIAQIFRPSRPIREITAIDAAANANVTGNANTSIDASAIGLGDCGVWAGAVFGTSTSTNHFFDHDEMDAAAVKTIHDVGSWDNRSAYSLVNNDLNVVDTSAQSNPSVSTSQEAATNIFLRVRG